MRAAWDERAINERQSTLARRACQLIDRDDVGPDVTGAVHDTLAAHESLLDGGDSYPHTPSS